jgi:hypothetical protein
MVAVHLLSPGVSQCWFSGHFRLRQVFFNTNALPRINIGAAVWGESSIIDRCLLTLVLVYFAHRLGSV